MNQEENSDQSTASEDRSCKPTAQGAQNPGRHADVSGAATNITRDENEKIDTSAEPLPIRRKVEPHEWCQLLCKLDCLQLICEKDYPRLEREWDRTSDFGPEFDAQFDKLFFGSAESTLGITSEDVDLRLAEFLARKMIKPSIIFFLIGERYRYCKRVDQHFTDSHNMYYINSVVRRTFQMLFDEAVVAGLAYIINEERLTELFTLVTEEDDA